MLSNSISAKLINVYMQGEPHACINGQYRMLLSAQNIVLAFITHMMTLQQLAISREYPL